MHLKDIKSRIPEKFYEALRKEGISELRPSQSKSVQAGLLERKNILVCTPTASGKTLVGEIAAIKSILEAKGKSLYIVPLKALATEKYREFVRKYPFVDTALSIGDLDSPEHRLAKKDLIVCTAEKLDSLLRHKVEWIKDVGCIVVDEIHLLNDPGRGPTLEIILTITKRLLPQAQIVGLSATIGNPEDLADWLDAELVLDDWRPVELKKGIYLGGKIEFL